MTINRYEIWRKLVAEFLGTFALVFVGVGAIAVNDVSGGAISGVGVALAFGLVVTVVIYILGDVSGAHINPAVTVGLWAARRHPFRLVGPYVLSQCAGALLASILLRLLFPAQANLGITVPAGPSAQSFVLEIGLAWILMFVILMVTTGPRQRKMIAGAAIGAVIAIGAFLAGPVSGASMNPARSLGPALVAGHLDSLWIYLGAPVLGALLAIPLCRWVHPAGCCGAAAETSP